MSLRGGLGHKGFTKELFQRSQRLLLALLDYVELHNARVASGPDPALSLGRLPPPQRANKYVFVKPARTPRTKIGRKWGPRAPPDIVGLSYEIIGFRDRGGGPVGHP